MSHNKQQKIYANFASVYDYLMTDIPYNAWVDYLQRLFGHFCIKATTILDLGCGTGNISIPLAALGFDVTGADLSPEMLSVAEQKARDRNLNITFLRQDMRHLEISGPFDVVISMVDSFNYMIKDEDMVNTLKGVSRVLSPKGWLIFDLNSAYKIEKVFGNNTYALVEEQVCYIWENQYDSASRVCDIELTFFVKDDKGLYERFTENHKERAFELAEIREFLAQADFSFEGAFGELSFKKPSPEEERLFIIAKKL